MMTNQRHSNLSLNHKMALKLSLSISLVLAFFMVIGVVFSGRHNQLSGISFFNAIIQCNSSLLILFLLYEFCFWVFRKVLGKRKKKHFIALFGTIGIAILMSLVFSQITYHIFQPKMGELLLNRFIVLSLIKNLVLSLIVYLSDRKSTRLNSSHT